MRAPFSLNAPIISLCFHTSSTSCWYIFLKMQEVGVGELARGLGEHSAPTKD